jgi:hypothetical protein
VVFHSQNKILTSAGSKQRLSLCAVFAKIKPATDFLKKLWGFVRPLTHWLASVLPEFHASVSQFGWALVVGTIPAIMLVRIALACSTI